MTSSHDGHGRGDLVVASFRQEGTLILTHAGTEENIVPGRIVSTSFLGSFLRCVVNLGTIGEVIAKVPVLEALKLGLPNRIGEVIYVRANRDQVMIFDRPERPLAVELETF